MEENNNEYIYIKYEITVSLGDIGLDDKASLTKHVTKISKETGTINTHVTNIKKDVVF